MACKRRSSLHLGFLVSRRPYAFLPEWLAVSLGAVALVAIALTPALCQASWANNGNQACSDPKDQFNAQAISDGKGGMIVTWEDYRVDTADIYAQHFDASGMRLWGTNGVAICTFSDYQISPVLCSDGAGGAVIAWQDRRKSTEYDIYAQAVAANGTLKWVPSTGVPICQANGNQILEVIASDGAGGGIIGWRDSRGANADVYAQRVSSTGSTLWTLDGVAVCTAAGQQNDVRIVPDQLGGAYLVWRDPRNGIMNNDIYAQSLDSSGLRRWAADGIPVCSVPQDLLEPAISGDGRYGLLVAWTDLRNGSTNEDIFAQRIRPDGSPRWTVDGVQVCAADSTQRTPLIVSDGFGGAIVAWTDQRASHTHPDIYAQRVDSTGTNAWLPSLTGVSICSADSGQFIKTMIPSGAGGAIIGWDDERGAGQDEDLYAQSVSLAGATRWALNGTRFATGSSTRVLTTSAQDGYGGVLFAWQDFRNGATADIYGLRMTSVGTGVEIQGSPRVSARTLQAKPNPFNPETIIGYTLEAPARFDLSILDIQGRLVRVLARGFAAAGPHTQTWDGLTGNGTPCASGAYFAVLSTSTGRRTASLRLIR